MSKKVRREIHSTNNLRRENRKGHAASLSRYERFIFEQFIEHQAEKEQPIANDGVQIHLRDLFAIHQ